MSRNYCDIHFTFETAEDALHAKELVAGILRNPENNNSDFEGETMAPQVLCAGNVVKAEKCEGFFEPWESRKHFKWIAVSVANEVKGRPFRCKLAAEESHAISWFEGSFDGKELKYSTWYNDGDSMNWGVLYCEECGEDVFSMADGSVAEAGKVYVCPACGAKCVFSREEIEKRKPVRESRTVVI